jgi:hypothetical protein
MAMHEAEQLLLRWKIISRLYLELATREEEVKNQSFHFEDESKILNFGSNSSKIFVF